MVYSLLYVSKTLLEHPFTEEELDKLVKESAARYAELGITSVLLTTGTYFAHLLEGAQDEVETLMQSLDADPRHMRVTIIRTAQEERRFSGSLLVYVSHASFGERQIAPFFHAMPEGDTAYLALRLVSLMEGFVRLPSS